MEKLFWSSKSINDKNYMELGIDDNNAVLYVYKNGELFDYHFSAGTSFSQEMKNILDCYVKTHQQEPSLNDIKTWRQWFTMLKENNVIK